MVEQDRWEAWKQFRAVANLTGVSGVPKSIEEEFGSYASILAISLTLQFHGILLCPDKCGTEKLRKKRKKD